MWTECDVQIDDVQTKQKSFKDKQEKLVPYGAKMDVSSNLSRLCLGLLHAFLIGHKQTRIVFILYVLDLKVLQLTSFILIQKGKR